MVAAPFGPGSESPSDCYATATSFCFYSFTHLLFLCWMGPQARDRFTPRTKMTDQQEEKKKKIKIEQKTKIDIALRRRQHKIARYLLVKKQNKKHSVTTKPHAKLKGERS